LWLRAEVTRTRDVITNHHHLSLDKYVAPRWKTKQREAIAHLYDSLILLGEEKEKYFHRRWHSLPHGLQIKEPHAPNTLHISLLMTPLYKEDLRKMK